MASRCLAKHPSSTVPGWYRTRDAIITTTYIVHTDHLMGTAVIVHELEWVA